MSTIDTDTMSAEDQALILQIEKVISMFRPILQEEGGDAQVLSLSDGVARISFGGGCEGCGGSLKSIEGGFRTTLMERVPNLKDVILIS
jgi:Fe-S cluster biogenesis protein NfuA